MSSTLVKKPHNLAYLSPNVTVYWYTGKGIRVELGYAQFVGVPSIAQLSETDQWLDTRLVYHGNPLLRQYREHTFF